MIACICILKYLSIYICIYICIYTRTDKPQMRCGTIGTCLPMCVLRYMLVFVYRHCCQWGSVSRHKRSCKRSRKCGMAPLGLVSLCVCARLYASFFCLQTLLPVLDVTNMRSRIMFSLDRAWECFQAQTKL